MSIQEVVNLVAKTPSDQDFLAYGLEIKQCKLISTDYDTGFDHIIIYLSDGCLCYPVHYFEKNGKISGVHGFPPYPLY